MAHRCGWNELQPRLDLKAAFVHRDDHGSGKRPKEKENVPVICSSYGYVLPVPKNNLEAYASRWDIGLAQSLSHDLGCVEHQRAADREEEFI